MTLVEYQTLAESRKGLPTAVYVFREAGSDYGRELNQLLAMLVARHELGEQFNVIKFRTDELEDFVPERSNSWRRRIRRYAMR